MPKMTSIAQNLGDNNEWIKKDLRRLKNNTLLFFVVVLAVIGLIIGYYVSSDLFLGPFKRVSYAMLSPSSVELALETRSPMRTRVEYGTSKDFVNQKRISPIYTTEHSVSIDGLLPGKPHMVRFVAEDQAGRVYFSDFYQVQ